MRNFKLITHFLSLALLAICFSGCGSDTAKTPEQPIFKAEDISLLKSNNKKYFIHKSSGDTLFDKQGYDFAEPFVNSFAIIGRKNGSKQMPDFQFLSLSGALLKTEIPLYGKPGEFKNACAIVSVAKKGQAGLALRGVINEQGKFIIPPIYAAIKYMGRGLFKVSTEEGKCGLINKNNRILIACQYNEIHAPYEGICMVSSMNENYEEKLGFVDTLGKTIAAPIYTKAFRFSGGIAAVKNEKGQYGYLNKDGSLYLDFVYSDVYAWVRTDLAGSIVMPFTDMSNNSTLSYFFGDSLLPLVKNSKIGLINREKKIVLPYEYTDVKADSSAYVILTKNKLQGIYGCAQRKILLPCAYESVSIYKNKARLKTRDGKEEEVELK